MIVSSYFYSVNSGAENETNLEKCIMRIKNCFFPGKDL